MRASRKNDGISASLPTTRDQLANSTDTQDSGDSSGIPPFPNDVSFSPFPFLQTTVTPEITNEDLVSVGITITGDWPGAEKLEIDSRFEAPRCKMAKDNELLPFSSRVCVRASETERVARCGASELCLTKDLRERAHSFESNAPLSSPQTSPRAQVSYPQGQSFFSDDVSLVRSGAKMHSDVFGNLRVDAPTLLRLALKHGKSSDKRDGVDAATSGKNRRLDFGCCGQARETLDDGASAPAPARGLQALDKHESDKEASAVRGALADSLGAMQICAGEVEMKHNRSARPRGCEPRAGRRGKSLREGAGACTFRLESVTAQAKRLNRGEREVGRKDDKNCAWSGRNKAATPPFATRGAKAGYWPIKIVVNSRATAGRCFARQSVKKPAL